MEAEPVRHLRITLHVNGAEHALEIDTRTSLLDLLREELRLTGAEKGCDHGQCGACTVLIDGRRANACRALAVAHAGAGLPTAGGPARPPPGRPRPPPGRPPPAGASCTRSRPAFVEPDGVQCGYSTPGQIVAA